jgi:hypothetical protein
MSMKDKRYRLILLVVMAAGFATPWVVPQSWLGYILGGGILAALVWGALCAVNAKSDKSSHEVGLLSLLLPGMDRPTAEVTDGQALTLFLITLLYLASCDRPQEKPACSVRSDKTWIAAGKPGPVGHLKRWKPMSGFKRRHVATFAVAVALAVAVTMLAPHRNLYMGWQSSQRPLPRVILPDLLWSMSEPVPASTKEMVSALSAYAQDVKGSVNLAELETIYPRRTIDIRYKTWVRPSGVGEWSEVARVIPIRFQREPTYADIMFELHKAVHAQLRKDDHRFFEGLEFSDGSAGEDTPIYELILGS